MLETNQQLGESCARMEVHFDQIMTHLNQPSSTPIPDQTQEFHQFYQVNQFDVPQDSTPRADTIFESVPSSFHLNQIKEFEQDDEVIHELDTHPVLP